MERAADKTNAYFLYEWEGQFNNYYSHKSTNPFEIRLFNSDSIKPFKSRINFSKDRNGVVIDNIFYPFNVRTKIKGNDLIITPNNCPEIATKNWIC